MDITTIAFDFGGVLVTKIDDIFLCHMAEAAGAPRELFIEGLWKFRNSYDSGELDAHGYWGKVLAHCGRRIDQETFDVLMHLDGVGWSSIRPAMVRWISALRKEGYRRLIISNMAAETYDLIIRHSVLPDYFETVVLSGWIGINKPDKRIFMRAREEMAVPPGEILFIDDLIHNVEGAREAGFHALPFVDPATLAEDLRRHYPRIPVTGLSCP